MTRLEIIGMMRETGVPFDEKHPDHINADKFLELEPPFMEYAIEELPIHADGSRYLTISQMRINLYSDTEETLSEESIEHVLEHNDLRWRKQKEFIEEILMWNITYTLEV